MHLLLLLVLLVSMPAVTRAEVVEAAPNGFFVRFEGTVAATPEKAYAALTEVGNWWNMEHSYSGDGKMMTLDARPGGCFCEKLPGGGVEHMRVVFALPANTLRMVGGLGPLQGRGIAGAMTWRFVAAPPGTKIEMTYMVGGFMPGGLDKVANGVDGVLGDAFARAKRYIETGKPTAS
jgi:hypothetical protein